MTTNLAATTPREDFRALAAEHRVVPVTRKVLADSETIRTALMRNGVAHVQVGGGVVADSNGPYEYTEVANKARAVLNAIAAAETLAEP